MKKSQTRKTRGDANRLSARQKQFLKKINLNAAGIDIGAQAHWVAVPEGRDEVAVRKFGVLTPDLVALADWLQQCGVDTVAMESTGVYWIPLYELLEERGLSVCLVNARHVKNVPGRKDDCIDCQWLQQLHSFGLLRSSFRPTSEIAALRTYVRHRDTLVAEAGSWVQRIQKALVLMNLQIHTVISDITGVTGMKILRDIVAGQTDPNVLAQHRDYRIRASDDAIVASLTGHYRDEHLFLLRQALQMYDYHHEQIRGCDVRIESIINQLKGRSDRSKTTPPPPRRAAKPRANEPCFEIRSPLFTICAGVDITQLPGIGPYNALRLISEVGVDMSKWPSDKHFVSWLALSPNSKISGGKLLASATRPSANRAAATFRMAALSLSRSDNALAAFFRRIAVRVGKAKAITATARKLASLFYRTLSGQLPFRNITAGEYDASQRTRSLHNLKRRAASLGVQILDPTTGQVLA